MDENIVNKLQLPSSGSSDTSTVFQSSDIVTLVTPDISNEPGHCMIPITSIGTIEQYKTLNFDKLFISIQLGISKTGNMVDQQNSFRVDINNLIYLPSTNINWDDRYSDLFNISDAYSWVSYKFDSSEGVNSNLQVMWSLMPIRCRYYIENNILVVDIPEKITDSEGNIIDLTQYTHIRYFARLEFI